MIEKYPVRKVKYLSDSLTKREREEKWRQSIYSMPETINDAFTKRIESIKTMHDKTEEKMYNQIYK